LQGGILLHPKAAMLGLVAEKIVGLSACVTHASVWTESGKVATFVDESVQSVAGRMEHAALHFPEFQASKVTTLVVSATITCALLESGALYWW
jgi:E3 ubiquitin-protein ligase EDD1